MLRYMCTHVDGQNVATMVGISKAKVYEACRANKTAAFPTCLVLHHMAVNLMGVLHLIELFPVFSRTISVS